MKWRGKSPSAIGQQSWPAGGGGQAQFLHTWTGLHWLSIASYSWQVSSGRPSSNTY